LIVKKNKKKKKKKRLQPIIMAWQIHCQTSPLFPSVELGS
jgi:hypothetical protein